MRWIGGDYKQPLVELKKTKEILKADDDTGEIYQILFIQDDNVATWNYDSREDRDSVFELIEDKLTSTNV